MSASIALAVDGGNSKTDLALVRSDGVLLAFVRGPLGSPHHIGLQGCVTLLGSLLDDAVHMAGLEQNSSPIADVANLMLAGLDFPREEQELHDAVAGLGWAANVEVHNDTFAVLRAGTDRGWGIAVTCGSGINCVGIGPDGHHVRFPSLGAITGDWGGGYDLGVAALGAAARSQDGRGLASTLEGTVPAYFAMASPLAVAEAIHTGRLDTRRLTELAPLVFRAADQDEVAAELIRRLSYEVVAFVRATAERLELGHLVPEVLLGGGLMQAANQRLVQASESALRELGLAVSVSAVADPPIVGAALLGLDAVGADRLAHDRIRQQLRAAATERGRVEGAIPAGHDPEPAGITSSERGDRG